MILSNSHDFPPHVFVIVWYPVSSAPNIFLVNCLQAKGSLF